MRVLHTSDWHLGAGLEGVSREADHAAFLEWLAQTLEREEVDCLVVAGDVFDQAHPSSEAQRLYYRFLRRISGRAVEKVVVVGGNHDSASRLDAPSEVLSALDVHVVGGVSADRGTWARCLCPIPGANGGVDAVVVAVPFVHEFRLGVRTTSASEAEIRAAFEGTFADFYRGLCDMAEALHDGAPLLATGHLNCEGYERGDSPADIHLVGAIGGLSPRIFDERLKYVALGHIHRSYRVGESAAYYSGSPIPLSAREGRTPRSVRIVDVTEAGAQVRRVEVPLFRRVVELSGTEEAVKAQLRALSWEEELPPITFARVQVDRFSPGIDDELRRIVASAGVRAPLLVQVRQELAAARDLAAAAQSVPVASLRDVPPEEVFRRLCMERGEPVDDGLLNAFRSLQSVEMESPAAPVRRERGAA